ncbi:MAG: hypothetical protein V3T23_12665 [Nitrososphaerales archaeon]
MSCNMGEIYQYIDNAGYNTLSEIIARAQEKQRFINKEKNDLLIKKVQGQALDHGVPEEYFYCGWEINEHGSWFEFQSFKGHTYKHPAWSVE